MRRIVLFTILQLAGIAGASAQTTISCQVLPPVYYFDTAVYRHTGEIRLGEARLYPVWAVSADARIPDNRITWAMAMAHAHQLFRNSTGTDKIPLNTYFATALKESFCGCDPAIVPDPQSLYPLSYQPASVNDGCFQIEGPGSAYAELNNLYPQRFPAGGHPQLIGGDHFETAALAKAYYDLYAVRYLDLSRNWNPLGFAAQATDSLAFLKALLAAYNRGLWDPIVQSIFQTDRPQALATSDLHTLFPPNSVVLDYSTNITNYVLALDSQITALSPALQASNTFYGFYDEPVTLNDIDQYLDIIFPMYPDADTANIRLIAHHAFHCVNGGSPISFRYQFGEVLDAIVLNLPVDDPGEQIIISYGCNGVWPDTTWNPVYLPNLQTPEFIDCFITDAATVENQMSISVFPNPVQAGQQLNIDNEGMQIDGLQIFDASGKECVCMALNRTATRLTLQLPALSPGAYVLRLKAGQTLVNRLLIITP